MIRVNLLPKELQEKGKGLDWIILGYGVIFLIALGAVGSYFMRVQIYKKNILKKERWAQQLAEIKAKVARVEQLDAQKNLLNAKKNTVVQLFQGRILYPRFMEQLFKVMPKDIWLTDLTISEDGAKNLRVVALSNSLSTDAIADWLQTMETSPDRYTEVSLSAIEVRQPAEAKSAPYFTFSMTFTFHPPAVGS